MKENYLKRITIMIDVIDAKLNNLCEMEVSDTHALTIGELSENIYSMMYTIHELKDYLQSIEEDV